MASPATSEIPQPGSYSDAASSAVKPIPPSAGAGQDDPTKYASSKPAAAPEADTKSKPKDVDLQEQLKTPRTAGSKEKNSPDVAVNLPPGHVEEKFRVDRRKLEHLIVGNGRFGESGDQFFNNIMKTSQTDIDWPSKLKIGAKSKKDPHVKVRGLPANVESAKQMVLAVLDTKSNRVTIKIDVSHTEHSHIIGKGGANIKAVMHETGCHIHFPDCNAITDRRIQMEKCNQVTISGQPEAVERARALIRQLLPITLTFDISACHQLAALQNSPNILQMQSTYEVQVNFTPQVRQGPVAMCQVITCEVRGSQKNAQYVATAAKKLIELLVSANPLHSVPVVSVLDIAPQHHVFMIGRNSNNVRRVMESTGTTVIFPDSSLLAARRRSQVTITGTVDAVLQARQILLGCLPLVLMFDIKEDERSNALSESKEICQLMESLDVYISIKPMPPKYRVIIKSIERNAKRIYKARQCLFDDTLLKSLNSPAEQSAQPAAGFSLTNHDWPSLSGENFSALSMDDLQNIPGSPGQKRHASSMTRLRRGSLPNVATSTSSQRSPAGRQQGVDRVSSRLASSAAALRSSDSSGHLSPIAAVAEGTPTHTSAMPRSASYSSSVSAASESSEPSASAKSATTRARFHSSPDSTELVQRENRSPAPITFTISDDSSSSLSSSPLPTANKSNVASGQELAWLRPLLDVQPGKVSCKELPSLLQKIGIEAKYTALLEAEEVDLVVLSSLTDADLKEIGIKRFGPRKKLLLAIQQLQLSQGASADVNGKADGHQRNGIQPMGQGAEQHSDTSTEPDSDQSSAMPSSPSFLHNADAASYDGQEEAQAAKVNGLRAPAENSSDVVNKYALSPGKHSQW